VTTLLAYPNVSEGRDQQVIDEIAAAFGAHLLDVHTDPDHHRSAYTLAGAPGELAQAVAKGAQTAVARIELPRHEGQHPRVGVIDVAAIIHLTQADRGAACAEALVLADLLAERLSLPVFMYGALGGGRTRAQLRRGGPQELARRLQTGELAPDFGPPALHPTAGAALVAARPPLVAFNVELAPPATVEQAKRIAALVREGGEEGLPGVRAIGLWLAHRERAQVSTNVEDPGATSLAAVVAAVQRHHEVAGAELVGLAPRAAFDGFPSHLELRGYATIEDAVAHYRDTA
jgi:glutamate formiminotransferase